jgi:hypothetical protein
VFAPTKVHLKANGTPLAEVLRELSKQSQIRLQLAREPADLATRRVTLDTGATSFWEALDVVCRQAKVSIRSGAVDVSAIEAPQAAGNVAWMVVTTAARADETLVIQDGAPPAYPTAYLGAVRVRLVPDLWGNRDRGAGEEYRWTLEVLSEPRVTWQEPPGFQFDPATGLTLTPAAANRAATAPAVNFAVAGGGAVRRVGTELTAALRTVTRHELPVNIKSDGPAGQKVPELKGILAGKAQLAAETIAAVADVTKADAATAAGKDGAKLTVRDCQVNANGAVTLKVEVERPAAGGPVAGNVVAQQRIQIGGAVPANIAQVMNNLGGTDEKMRLFDTQDRPYSISVSESSTSRNNGVVVANYTLDCQPVAPGAQPRKLELHGPRWVSVEGRFVLRDVPRP